jgi:ubiquinone/menaquinone biosynthesis C-methylase UbiE
MSVMSNKAVFSAIEFDSWTQRKRLIPAERFLIERYLDKRSKTLEAGTGGGRILLEMKALGFTSLHGFDFVPEFIEQARGKDVTHSICFEVQDAPCLSYGDSSFDQIIYLQQVICFIEDEASRLKALQEAYRILKRGGTALFSFLSFEARRRSAMYLPYLVYLSFLRKLRRSNRTIQYLPWLRLAGKFNFSSLLDTGPYVYWYKLKEITQLLRDVGFKIIAIGSTYQIKQGGMPESYEAFVNEPIEGMLYVVGQK